MRRYLVIQAVAILLWEVQNHPKSEARNPQPQILNPKPTLIPKPYALNPEASYPTQLLPRFPPFWQAEADAQRGAAAAAEALRREEATKWLQREELYLNPKIMRNNSPKPIIIALRAIILWTFGVQVGLGVKV